MTNKVSDARDFDFVVVGGGSAGYAAARTAHEHGAKVAIVDGAEELGGLCILRGCMPSKTLIYTAELLHHAKHAATFGLSVEDPRADMRKVRDRKRTIIEEFASYRREQLEADRFTLFRSRAKFVDAHTLELDTGERVKGRFFMIATGSSVSTPPVPGLDEVPFWTSDDILDLDTLPESIIVLGGGVVACELAQYLRRMGSAVTQIQRSPNILKETSPEAGKAVAKVFRAEGIELFTDTELEEVAHGAEEFTVRFQHQGKTVERKAQRLLNALGRKPATEGLGLETVGVALRKSGHIACNNNQQTSVPHIYAAGDCSGPNEIVHVAILQGETGAAHAFGKAPLTPYKPEHLVSVVFTDPQVASAGLSKKELEAKGVDFIAADYPFDDHGKSILMEARSGYVAVFAERSTKRILGAECVGKDAGELIHSLAVGITLGATARELLQVQWYHPTLSEIWSYPLEDVLEAD